MLRSIAAGAVGLTLLLPACTSSGSSACSRPVQEKLDSRSTVHLFPGAPEPTYLTDPPTSGPHRLGPHPTGVATDPIDRPGQVAMLEQGTVLIQYREPADGAALAGLAIGRVVVAPNPTMKPRIAATAWTWKLTCSRPDAKTLAAFAAKRAGHGP